MQMLELKPTGKEGLFAIELPLRKTGEHTLLLHSGGKTFNRTREFRVAVTEPAPQNLPAQPVQKPQAAPSQSEVNWQWVLMQFGMVNAGILGVIIVFLAVRKAGAALAARKKAAAQKAAEKQSEHEPEQ